MTFSFFYMSNSSGQVCVKIPLIEAEVWLLLCIFIFQLDLKSIWFCLTAELKTEVRITLKGQIHVLILHGGVKNISVNWFLHHLCHHFRSPNIKRQAALCSTGLGHSYPVSVDRSLRKNHSYL